MTKPTISSRLSVVMALVAFTVAAMPAFGVVMGEDPIGRAIFTVVWVVIGLAWIGHLIRRKTTSST